MKKNEALDILKKISFENELVQVLSLCPKGKEVSFPSNRGPVDFSVLGDRGLSHRWGVRTGPKGDAYIYNRDVKDAEKISLHASGHRHIAISKKMATQVGASDRFGPRWTGPTFDREAVPTVSLLFPPWGVGDMRPENLAARKSEVLIVGHIEKTIVVGFFIMDAEKKLQVNAPRFVLGRLMLQPGRILYIVVWQEPENNLRARLRASLKQAPAPLPQADNFVICFQGFRAPDSAFIVAVPAAALI